MFYYILRYTISVLSILLFHRHVIGGENIPKHRACIVVANHVNLLDSPILGVSLGRRVYFMAKEELFQSRVTGWLAEQFGAFAVAKGRLNRRAGRKALELLAHGQPLIIFPEGKRSDNGELGKAYRPTNLQRESSPAAPQYQLWACWISSLDDCGYRAL